METIGSVGYSNTKMCITVFQCIDPLNYNTSSKNIQNLTLTTLLQYTTLQVDIRKALENLQSL